MKNLLKKLVKKNYHSTMTDKEKLKKIIKLLGNDYHLSLKYDGSINWILFKKYIDSEIYFSKDNKPIMSSKENSLNELLNFAKKHHKWNYCNFAFPIIMPLLILVLILIAINSIFFKSGYLGGLFIGIDFGCFIGTSIYELINIHNDKIELLEIDECYKKNINRRKNDISRENN